MLWKVEIVEFATDKVERSFEYATERLAEKASDGINRNLNHEVYFTRVTAPIAGVQKEQP